MFMWHVADGRLTGYHPAMELTILGASGAWPAPGGAANGFLVRAGGYHLVLDFGMAALPNLQRYLPYEQIDAIFISHEHWDHCLDLYPLFLARFFRPDPLPPLPVLAPAGVFDRIAAMEDEEGVVEIRKSFECREVEPSPFRRISRMAAPRGWVRNTTVAAATVAVMTACTTRDRPSESDTAQAATVRNGAIAYVEFFAGLQYVEPPGSTASPAPRIEDPEAQEVSFLDWSPDGRHLAYVDGDFFLGESSIVVLDADTGEKLRLTSGSLDASPVWSPDGRRIAFFRFSRGSAALWVMNEDGSRATAVTSPGERPWRPFTDPNVFPPPRAIDPATVVRSIAWSPDSKRIAFAVDPFGKQPEVGIVPLYGNAELTILEGSYPTWSPDGTRLCLVRRTPSGTRLVTISPDGADQEAITNGTATHTMPRWSPDGGSILYVSDEEGPPGKLELWVMGSDGSGAEQVTSDATELSGHDPWDLFPSWSPDGSMIVYLDQVFGGGAVDEWVSVISSNGGPAEILTQSESDWPAWQPIPV
jgi:Tol biopolymer transport system component